MSILFELKPWGVGVMVTWDDKFELLTIGEAEKLLEDLLEAIKIARHRLNEDKVTH